MALYPCAYSMTFNVSGNTLNAVLNQRSPDMLAASVVAKVLPAGLVMRAQDLLFTARVGE